MADNTTLNPGTGGDVVASDDIGGVKYQRVKLVLGADGINDGDLSSVNPMPVADDALLSILKLLIARVQPLSIITGAGSNRLSVDINNVIGGTLTTVGTVSAVTNVANVTTVANVANQSQMGGVTAFALMHAASRTAFNTGTRTRI